MDRAAAGNGLESGLKAASLELRLLRWGSPAASASGAKLLRGSAGSG
jgi:hypothetical protein